MVVHSCSPSSPLPPILPLLQLPAQRPRASLADPDLLGSGLLGGRGTPRADRRVPGVSGDDVLPKVNCEL